MTRAAYPADHAAIHALVSAAYRPGRRGIACRSPANDGDERAELIAADDDGTIVGHMLFSRLGIGDVDGAALARLAVDPARQRAGIGGALTVAGLAPCRSLGVSAVVVLGHPAYYPRFGFAAARAALLTPPFGGASLMAIELMPGALAAGGVLR